VQCDRCKRYFHMRCVQPPLIAKPSRGYGWTCAPCSRRHEQEVDSHEVRHATPQGVPKPLKSNAPAPRGRGRPRKDKLQAEREENFPVKHFKMWPFRYFG
jgi:PHD-finger